MGSAGAITAVVKQLLAPAGYSGTPRTALPSLRNLRQRRGLTQRQLATLAGVARNTIIRVEQGRTRPHAATVLLLAEALGVAPAALYDGETREKE